MRKFGSRGSSQYFTRTWVAITLVALLLVGYGGTATATAATLSGSAGRASTNSAVYTWGADISASPTVIGGLPANISEIQAANWGGLVVNNAGNVYQWVHSPNPTPALVSGPTNVVSIGEGGGIQYGAAVTSSGALWTWGHDAEGQLCNGTTGLSFAPGKRAVNNAVSVSGGAQHLEFLTSTGDVQGCGINDYGQLGDGTTANSTTPVKALGLPPVAALSAGNQFTLALDTSGHVWAWGLNDFGQLGDGRVANSDVPVEVSLPAPATEIFAGGSGVINGQSIALLSDGKVYAWGNDAAGQLGNQQIEPYSSTPVEVAVPAHVTFDFVASGGSASYALDSNGNLWAWGDDSLGQLGDGNDTGYVLTPEKVASGFTGLSAVAGVVVGMN